MTFIEIDCDITGLSMFPSHSMSVCPTALDKRAASDLGGDGESTPPDPGSNGKCKWLIETWLTASR